MTERFWYWFAGIGALLILVLMVAFFIGRSHEKAMVAAHQAEATTTATGQTGIPATVVQQQSNSDWFLWYYLLFMRPQYVGGQYIERTYYTPSYTPSPSTESNSGSWGTDEPSWGSDSSWGSSNSGSWGSDSSWDSGNSGSWGSESSSYDSGSWGDSGSSWDSGSSGSWGE